MKNKTKIIILSSLLGIVLLIMLGVTYAYFVAGVTGSETSTTITADAGKMSIIINGGANITANNMYPYPEGTSFATKTFTVTGTNTTTKNMPYTVSLIIDSNTFQNGSILYTLESTNTGSNGAVIASVTTLTSIGTGAKTINLGTGYFKNASSKVHTYTLKLFYPETNTDQSANMEATIGAHISVTAGEAYEPLDSSGANTPTLADNMIPVYYDNTLDVWKVADKNNVDASNQWYDYNTQMWANAVTVTSSKRTTYNTSAEGTPIPMDDIMGMWVWIPRYEYMTTNLGTNYAGGTLALPGGISINFISGTSTTNTTNYLIHPAFRDGSSSYTLPNGNTASNYSQGGWDKELTGFWFAKFEVGYASNNETDAAISSNILVKPDVYSMRYQNVSSQYTTVQNIQTDHGIGNTIETHMSKNDEWGAVTYLTQSAYGKYGNADYTGANKEVYVNNAMDSGYTYFTTGRSNGTYGGGSGSGSSQYGTYEYNNCPASAYTKTVCTESTRTSNNTKGTGASTTGNIYGIYDMSGGAFEYLMINYADTIASSGMSSMPSAKYYNKVTTTQMGTSACNGNPCYGHGLSEVNNGSFGGSYNWYNDYMTSGLSSSGPWAFRGFYADFASTSYAGPWDFGNDAGGSYDYGGFRASIS